MKRVLCGLALLAGVAMLSGCASRAVTHRQGGIGLNGLAQEPRPAASGAREVCTNGAPVARRAPRMAARPVPVRPGMHGQAINPGPPTAAVTYPYYTVRGPRDFLQSESSSIGP